MTRFMIEIYGVKISNDIESYKKDNIMQFLTNEKRKKINRFIKAEDSNRALVAEVLLRTIICRKLSINNKDISIVVNDYGKPFLENTEEIFFNLSHSGEWVVCAIDDKPIGIDVECIRPIDIEIAKHVLTQREYDDLMSEDEDNRIGLLYEFWTLKESYIKAEGMGMSIPLKSFSFIFNGGIIIFETENVTEEHYFRQYEIDKSYKMAVCALKDSFPEDINHIDMDALFDEFIKLNHI